MKTTIRERWSHNHLTDQNLYALLEKVDIDVAEAAHKGLCRYCGSHLHRGNYKRKPRGGPMWALRFSFCCAQEDCRRRHTPPSVRFMGRRIYGGLIVVLVSAMNHGLTAERVRLLRKELTIDRRTLERWRQWWLVTFVKSSFWKDARARFMPPLCQRTLPLSLCLNFQVDERRDRLLALLKFLAPITTPCAWKELVM